MNTLVASAPSKVNLLLHSGGVDSSGYHPLVTVFEALSLRDYVEATLPVSDQVRPAGVKTLLYTSPLDGGDPVFSPSMTDGFSSFDNENHLAVRACAALGVEVGKQVNLRVHKTIPVAGGMAGGSADAAATLVLVNELFELGYSNSELQEIGSGLGADVPTCLVGGVSLGTGRGDRMTPLVPGTDSSDSNSHWWVLVFAKEGLSTPAVFSTFDSLYPDLGGLDAKTISTEIMGAFGNLPSTGELAKTITNSLQPATLHMRPELGLVGAELARAGALGWIVSGSGPTIAGLARNKNHAQQIAEQVSRHPDAQSVTIAWGPSEAAKIEEDLPEWSIR